jgi:hypothetical protein
MNHRWRHLRDPAQPGDAVPVRPLEALGLSVLGLLWALVTLGLASMGLHLLAPLSLLAGLVALWGWRGNDWLWWFPATLVVAALLELRWPLTVGTGPAAIGYIDLTVLAVGVVSVARALALQRPLVSRTPLDPMAAGLLIAGFVGVLVGGRGAVLDLKRIALAVAVFYAAAAVASRRGGARWVWPSFPLACTLAGLHAAWVVWVEHGTFDLPDQGTATWGSRNALVLAIVVSLVVTAGLALDAGRRRARHAWWVAAAVGVAGLVAVAVSGGLAGGMVLASPRPIDLAESALVLAALVVSARLAWRIARARPHERPRWTAVGLVFIGLAWLLPFTHPFTGPAARQLSAVAAGLAVGTARADARPARRPHPREGAEAPESAREAA